MRNAKRGLEPGHIVAPDLGGLTRGLFERRPRFWYFARPGHSPIVADPWALERDPSGETYAYGRIPETAESVTAAYDAAGLCRSLRQGRQAPLPAAAVMHAEQISDGPDQLELARRCFAPGVADRTVQFVVAGRIVTGCITWVAIRPEAGFRLVGKRPDGVLLRATYDPGSRTGALDSWRASAGVDGTSRIITRTHQGGRDARTQERR